MIDVKTAGELLDFGARIGGGQRAQEQLEGAVAIHNILCEHGVAYLADEVGMGKTYVALGALALFRHFNPDFRMLILAPRENIQKKWMKELKNFVEHNVRFLDMRVRSLDNRPAKPLISCSNLLELAHESMLNPNRDFFMRLTSFSLPLGGKAEVEAEAAKRLKVGLRKNLPWLQEEIFDRRNRFDFKDNIAKALCCALPKFDLIIVDEGHNLKHGLEGDAARNRLLAYAMGHPRLGADLKLFPGFGPRAKRVLFLSATPVEESYKHLWNQLDVFGLSKPFDGLRNRDLDEESKKSIAKKFLVRRVTAIKVGGQEHTKNLYRREWRRGGVVEHDEPIRIQDPRQRLIVALVQKKVTELIGGEKFKSSYQIGMLASFESFLETAQVKNEEKDQGNFDDTDQTDNTAEREGIDVGNVNRIAADYRRKFDAEMPHPKMDALVDSLSESWKTGEKALVFVRRVASVKELKKKIDERYDIWLKERLLRELPHLNAPLRAIFKRYQADRLESESAWRKRTLDGESAQKEEENDLGGNENFFVWFFRGKGPEGIISGANIQRRFIQRGTAYSTYFEDNHVSAVLECEPGDTESRLAEALGLSRELLKVGLQERCKRFLSGKSKRIVRGDRFEAIQASGIEWLKDHAGPYQDSARIIWNERFKSSVKIPHAKDAPDFSSLLNTPTFFTSLRRRQSLKDRIWPDSTQKDAVKAFRERELRAQLLSSAARLGHGFIDLYIMAVSRLESLQYRTQESADEDNTDLEVSRIEEYLDLLERQMDQSLKERGWLAFDELSQIAEHFDLILDVNEPEARNADLSETARLVGQLLRQQQPVGGMSGQVNGTLVRQFRMPGYPFILVSTDLLQEGEDLHSFCSAVHHYGISWTPSSMEQRIGRIDRVRSHTERRLVSLKDEKSLDGKDMLQVYFPHLEDTIEILQVQKVLERMNIFLRLMHEGIISSTVEEKSIDSNKEFARGSRRVAQISGRLHSAFPVQPQHLMGHINRLESDSLNAKTMESRFYALAASHLPGLSIEWEPKTSPGVLMGTARIGSRVQPFSLILKSIGAWPSIRCISPIGCLKPEEGQEAVADSAKKLNICIGAIITHEIRTYDLTVESDVLLARDASTDAARVEMLIQQVVQQADQLEEYHLPGKDEPLPTFKGELEKEGSHER